MSASTAPMIYQSQGALTLLSRAWNLMRSNLKKCLLIMAPPTLMNAVLQILFSLLSNKSFLTAGPATDFIWRILLLLGSLLFAIPTVIVGIISYCVLCRFFYLALMRNEAPSIRECLSDLRQKWLPLSGMIVLLGLVVLGLTGLNVIVFLLGLMMVGVIASSLGVVGGASNGVFTKIMMVIFVLVIGFAAFMLLIGFGVLACFLFLFPIASLLTARAEDRKSVWQHTGSAYKLLLRYIPGTVFFSVSLLLFSWALMGVFMAPVSLWAYIEMNRISLPFSYAIPLHIQIVLNLWSSLANIVMIPFLISAITLFWYDCQVRGQGLDIQLWLEKLRKRGSGASTPRTTES